MISVCMATYNGEKFIKQQIDSILCQLEPEDELIISDDNSTDSTIKIIESYNDKRIKLLHHKKNQNILNKKNSKGFFYASENFENALKNAKGDFIFLADQDDLWSTNKREVMLKALAQYDCVMSNFCIIDSEGNIKIDKFYKTNPIKKSLVQNILASRFLGCCMAFKRSVLDYVLPFPEFLIGHDYWIGCLANKKFSFYFLDEVLHKYRRTGTNVSASTEGSKNSIIYRILFRIDFSIKLLKKLLK